MSVANLTRYSLFAPGVSKFNGDLKPNPHFGEWVKFGEAMEASSNSLQQLKAEIAALAEKLHFAYEAADMDYKTIAESIEKLRQLSAV